VPRARVDWALLTLLPGALCAATVAALHLTHGQVRAIDVSASANGLFRVLVEQKPGARPWPKEPFVRLGAKVRGWVMMDTVSSGYELWRLLNDFPLQYPVSALEAGTYAGSVSGTGGKGGSSEKEGGNAK